MVGSKDEEGNGDEKLQVTISFSWDKKMVEYERVKEESQRNGRGNRGSHPMLPCTRIGLVRGMKTGTENMSSPKCDTVQVAFFESLTQKKIHLSEAQNDFQLCARQCVMQAHHIIQITLRHIMHKLPFFSTLVYKNFFFISLLYNSLIFWFSILPIWIANVPRLGTRDLKRKS